MDTMIVTGVDFVSVPTQDLERAVAFYGETLGLPCSVRRTGVCHMAFLADPDGNHLMLHHRYAPR
jgi:catechol 2,3-dioxygenase-like lactoylglutathione lyase family enzyme